MSDDEGQARRWCGIGRWGGATRGEGRGGGVGWGEGWWGMGGWGVGRRGEGRGESVGWEKKSNRPSSNSQLPPPLLLCLQPPHLPTFRTLRRRRRYRGRSRSRLAVVFTDSLVR